MTLATELRAAKDTKLAAINAVTKGLNQNDYTTESWAALQVLIDSAKMAADSALTLAELNSVSIPQTNMLVLKADKIELDWAIETAESKMQGNYSTDSWSKLQTALIAARTARDNDNATQAQVDEARTNLNNAIKELVSAQPIDGYAAALNAALNYLKTTVNAPNFGSIGGEWAVIALARGGYANTAYYDGYYGRILTETANKPEKLDQTKSTENARLALALTAIGVDASRLTAPYEGDMAWITAQGINGPIFALIALDSKPYQASEALKQDLIKYILDREISGGGWSLDNSANVDITAMAIQALAPYMSKSNVNAAVNRALAWLYAQKVADAEGNAQIIVALSALGIDAAAYVDALLTYYDYDLANGSFMRDGRNNLMATEQAAYALVAYDRYKTNKNSLYDMGDAAKLITDNVAPALADKTALNAEIARAEAFSEGGYTAASWSVLTTALNTAKAARDNANATQSQVDAAKNNLTTAISSLTLRPTPTDPTTQTKHVWISVTDPGATGSQTKTYYPLTQLEMNNNETAYSLLQRTGLDIAIATYSQYAGVYVSAINGFGEFSDGPNSGWMYKVNGAFPDYSSSLYTLKDGDKVEWVYTRNLGSDVGGGQATGGGATTPDIPDTPEGGGGSAGGSGGGSSGSAAATVKDGAATADAKASDIKDLVGEAKAKGETDITIAVTETKNAAAIELDLTVKSISEISKNGMSLTVQTDNGTVTFDAAALKEIAKGKKDDEKVRIVVEIADKASLSEAQKAAVGDCPIVNITVWVGETQIHDFKGTVTVKLTKIPNIAPEDYDLLTVYHMDDGGKITEMKGAKYDPATKTITFTTSHFSHFFVSEWINPFGDIKKADWFYRSVRYAYSNSLMVGTTAAAFAPETPLTRAMLVTILWRCEGSPTTKSGNTFKDVASGEWYTTAIAWANANGIVKGYNADTFGTDDIVTREQIAVILYRYAKYKGIDVGLVASLARFDDAEKVSDWAIQEMKWATGAGLINGMTDTTLAPDGKATRAQTATLLMRFIENINE